MQQQLHLFIVDPERRTALAARYGSRWLVPSLACAERVRAGLAALRWCAERGAAADVAGQWLGRVGPDATDWLIAIIARTPAMAMSPLEWIDLDALMDGVSVIDYQSWALGRCLRRGAMPTVPGPFGSLDWPERVRAWIGAAVGSQPLAWTPYRISAHEVVLGADTPRGRVYFKGLTGARTSEAVVTQTLAAKVPESFAATLVLDRRSDGTVWWLTGECSGRPSEDRAAVAASLARVQQRLMSCVSDLRELAVVDLDRAAAWARAVCGPDAGGRIGDACAYVMRADVPRAWTPMDLDPSNLLVDNGSVRFIDVDGSFVGPAPLAPAGYAGRRGDRRLYRAYQSSWSPPLDRIDWRQYEIAAVVFRAWLGWDSFRRNVERGEVCAPLDGVEKRVRERLARALWAIDRCPNGDGTIA